MTIENLKEVMRYGGAEKVILIVVKIDRHRNMTTYAPAEVRLKDVQEDWYITELSAMGDMLQVTCEVWE